MSISQPTLAPIVLINFSQPMDTGILPGIDDFLLEDGSGGVAEELTSSVWNSSTQLELVFVDALPADNEFYLSYDPIAPRLRQADAVPLSDIDSYSMPGPL